LTAINVDAGNTYYSSDGGVLFNKSKTMLLRYPAGKTGSSYAVPNSVTTIGESAFYNCSGLTGVNIGNSVETIGNYAFYNCSNLTGALTIPNSVITIGEGAFSGCTGLTGALTIGNSVTTISYAAFYDCSRLTSVTIGNSVTTIGDSAFYGCTGLTEVINQRFTPQSIDSYTFYNVPISNLTLKVPASAVAAYKAAAVWKGFGTIISYE
jgi:hypothetical protein